MATTTGAAATAMGAVVTVAAVAIRAMGVAVTVVAVTAVVATATGVTIAAMGGVAGAIATVVGAAATGAAVPRAPRRWAMRARAKAREVLPCMAWRAAASSRFGRNGGGAGQGAPGVGEQPGVSGGGVVGV